MQRNNNIDKEYLILFYFILLVLIYITFFVRHLFIVKLMNVFYTIKNLDVDQNTNSLGSVQKNIYCIFQTEAENPPK